MPVASSALRPLHSCRRSLGFILSAGVLATVVSTIAVPKSNADSTLIYANQGRDWTIDARSQFYVMDQGAQMIPYAWLKAMKRPDGSPFLSDSFARYGYLPNPDTTNGLPIGFSLTESSDGPMVGMTCAACHTRQITVSGQPVRIDGGPAIVDFESFLLDLNAASAAVLADPAAFKTFASGVLGAASTDLAQVAVLKADFTVWSVRFNTLMIKALPMDRRWGPARLDAVGMIFNRLTGLDLGRSPTYVIPQNIVLANAPTRYPFLWNASRQDKTQWPGFARNGDDLLALARNLGEVYGVFGTFHPQSTTGSVTLFDRNYIVSNSANFAGLRALEGLIKRIGPPAWQWSRDTTLAAKGKIIYEQVKTGPGGGATCADCHGIKHNLIGWTWKTPVIDVGTDQAEWLVLGRYASSGSLQGASIPLVTPTLLSKDLAFNMLTISVAGAIAQQSVSSSKRDVTQSEAAASLGAATFEAQVVPGASPLTTEAIGPAAQVPMIVATQTASTSLPQLGSIFSLNGTRASAPSAELAAAPVQNAYESRVLEGIWAAAPYLHNGSVPTLADLLKPAAQRPKSFAVGPAYDLTKLGLAAEQPGSTFVLRTTGCDTPGITSGDSNCGHEYGTQLSDDDKKALLEYMKTL